LERGGAEENSSLFSVRSESERERGEHSHVHAKKSKGERRKFREALSLSPYFGQRLM
jgi:hypothetical protein